MSKWIELETDASTGDVYLWKCDECGEEVTTRGNYCPECGDPKTSKGKRINTLVKALETEHRKLLELQNEQQAIIPSDCIIYCKDCVKHNKGVGDLEVLADGRRSWIWKDRACPFVSWRGKAQGHEFDYQYCVYAERRIDGQI